MNGFFNFRKLVVGVMAATCFMGFQSCLDDDDDYPYSKVLPNALVTVKPVDDGSYFLQLDDSTDLVACQYDLFSLRAEGGESVGEF